MWTGALWKQNISSRGLNNLKEILNVRQIVSLDKNAVFSKIVFRY